MMALTPGGACFAASSCMSRCRKVGHARTSRDGRGPHGPLGSLMGSESRRVVSSRLADGDDMFKEFRAEKLGSVTGFPGIKGVD